MYIMIHGSNLISIVVNKSYYYYKKGNVSGHDSFICLGVPEGSWRRENQPNTKHTANR